VATLRAAGALLLASLLSAILSVVLLPTSVLVLLLGPFLKLITQVRSGP
jgi:hypothetical protein